MEVDAQPPPWQQVVDKKVLKRLKGKEIKRQEFIHGNCPDHISSYSNKV